MRPQGDLYLAPGEQDVGMMPLLLRNLPNPVYKIQGLLEVGEGKRARDVVLADDLPMRPLRELLVKVSEFLAFQRRHSAAARHTSLTGKFRHKRSLAAMAK